MVMSETNEGAIPVCPNNKKFCKIFVDENENVFLKRKYCKELSGKYDFLTQEPKEKWADFVSRWWSAKAEIDATEEKIVEMKEEKENPKPKQVEQKNENEALLRMQLEEQGKMLMELANQLKELKSAPQQQALNGATYVIQAEKETKWGEKVSRNIPKEDLLPRPASFVQFGRGALLGVYNIRGGRSYAPYGGSIYFAYQGSDKRLVGKEEHYLPYCVFTTSSKKEADWIRESPLFGKTIHENVANALSTDPEFATKLTSIANYVNNIDANNLFSLAQSLGVGVKDNYETTKNMVCAKMLNDEMEKEKTRANEKIQSQSAELFLTKKTIDE